MLLVPREQFYLNFIQVNLQGCWSNVRFGIGFTN